MQESGWPVIAAAISGLLIGAGWYHPRVFGSLWMQGSGMTPEMAERGARYRHVHFILGFIAALVAADVLRLLLRSLEIRDAFGAMHLALLIWIGFVVPVSAGALLWEHRSVKFYVLNICYWLVTLIVMSYVLVL